MKIEHRSIIERAERNGMLPSEIASELLEHDLINVCIDNIPGFWDRSEKAQQDAIERATLGVKDAVRVAISTIAANGVITIPIDIKQVKVDAKNLTVTAIVDSKDPKKHDLVDSAGHLCLLVMAPNDYDEGLDAITPDRDQREMPLHVSGFESLQERFANDGPGEAGNSQAVNEAPDELIDSIANDGKEFGEFTYIDAKQLVILHAAHISVEWLQHRLAVDTDQATALILRMLDDGVVVLHKEKASPIDNIYKVQAKLADLKAG